MLARYLTLQNIRRVYAVFFFCLFLLLISITDFRNMKGYEISLFLEINPLISITTFLTSWTVYKGLVLSLIILVGTLILGRFFCSWICPLGILNQWISHLFNKRRPVDDYRVNAYRTVYRLKYYILAVLVVLGIFGSLQTGLLDPISFVMRSFILSIFPAFHYWSGGLYLKQPVFYGGILIAVIFLFMLFANRFITRFWCRVVCPLGALLGVFSSVSLLRIRRNVEKCTDCQKCLQFCHGGCDLTGIDQDGAFTVAQYPDEIIHRMHRGMIVIEDETVTPRPVIPLGIFHRIDLVVTLACHIASTPNDPGHYRILPGEDRTPNSLLPWREKVAQPARVTSDEGVSSQNNYE